MSRNRIGSNRTIWLASALSLLAVPQAALAAPNVTTDSAVFVERESAPGSRYLEPADSLAPGDRVVTIVRWYRLGGHGGFVITNPLPRSISYQNSSLDQEEVSVDGGRSWGRLDQLRIGRRVASPEDVTHVRWRISARSSALGTGQIAYSGIVRRPALASR